MSGPPILYITGTNTGVGKTFLAVQLLRAARERNLKIAALKPFCSGGRDDAEQLHALQTAGLTLDEVNPFHFRDPVTPLVAARNEGLTIDLRATLTDIEKIRQRNFPLLIEGAGGLLSPLGENFSLFDVIQKIPGKIATVGTDILGVLNGILLTSKQLPVPQSEQSVILMSPADPDASTATNADVLQSLLPSAQIFEVPFLTSQNIPSEIHRLLDWWIG